MKDSFMVGEAAKRAGVSPDTVRYYERIGLLPRAPRTAGGYRCYTDTAVARVLFVRNAIRFGFSTKQLSGFLHARDHGRPPCRSVRDAGQRLLGEMDRQLVELTAARAAMADTLAAWDAKLARTPRGAAAHLLADLPTLPARRNLRGRAAPSAD
jgi:DNA-binding transcriptional MerR regulator